MSSPGSCWILVWVPTSSAQEALLRRKEEGEKGGDPDRRVIQSRNRRISVTRVDEGQEVEEAEEEAEAAKALIEDGDEAEKEE